MKTDSENCFIVAVIILTSNFPQNAFNIFFHKKDLKYDYNPSD